MLMITPQVQEIGPAEARNRRKATVKILQNPLLRFLFNGQTRKYSSLD